MSTHADKLWVKAPAKVNLFLEVLRKRPDGYHDIRSILVPVSLWDVLRVERTDGEIETIIESLDMTLLEGSDHVEEGLLAGLDSGENLATRAAQTLKAATGYAGGARIFLRKRIPIGGGMGGGSADAAGALAALNRLWQTNLSPEAICRIGARVGCDVPAMVAGGAVCVEGIGEKLTPLRVPTEPAGSGWWLVLLNPGFGIATRDIYRRCSPSLTFEDNRFNKMMAALEEGSVAAAAEALFNGLQLTVVRKYPLIGILLEAMQAAGALGTLVSGSGATIFGLARDEEHARRIVCNLRAAVEMPTWLAVVKTLPDGVMVAHGPLEA